MSNPVINRLGKNQFWYSHFNSTNNYANLSKLNYSVPSLIKNYLEYSSSLDQNMMFNTYWYNKNIKRTSSPIYFKRVYFSNSILGIEHSYQIRLTISEYFPMKVWIMRYNSWLIIFSAWFKPRKKSLFVPKSDKTLFGNDFFNEKSQRASGYSSSLTSWDTLTSKGLLNKYSF